MLVVSVNAGNFNVGSLIVKIHWTNCTRCDKLSTQPKVEIYRLMFGFLLLFAPTDSCMDINAFGHRSRPKSARKSANCMELIHRRKTTNNQPYKALVVYRWRCVVLLAPSRRRTTACGLANRPHAATIGRAFLWRRASVAGWILMSLLQRARRKCDARAAARPMRSDDAAAPMPAARAAADDDDATAGSVAATVASASIDCRPVIETSRRHSRRSSAFVVAAADCRVGRRKKTVAAHTATKLR